LLADEAALRTSDSTVAEIAELIFAPADYVREAA
jgi:hypothetical protein